MTSELFNLILWIPFLLVIACVAIPFCMQGFRKGFFHALLSTAATVLAAALGFVAARILAPMAVEFLISYLPEFSDENYGVFAGIASALAEGLITGLLALIVFAIVLAILTPVCKFLLALVPIPRERGLLTRTLGAILRLADGIVLSILLLLPLYGTLAVYGPAINTIVTITEEPSTDPGDAEELSIRDYIQLTADHPVIALYRTEPVTQLYNALSTADTSLGQINIPKMLQTATQTADTFQALADGDVTADDLDALANIDRDMVESEWFYTAFTTLSEGLLSQAADAEDAPAYLSALQEMTTLSQEDFAQCFTGILDLMEYASEKGLFQGLEDGTIDEAWLESSGLEEKALEIQQTLPESSPFYDLISQLFQGN